MAEDTPVSQPECANECSCECECTCPCAKLIARVRQNSLVESFRTIYMWNDKLKSGIVFGVGFLFLLLAASFHFSLLSLFGFGLCISVVVGFIYAYGSFGYQKYIKKEEAPKDVFEGFSFDFKLSEDVVRAVTELVQDFITDFVDMVVVLFTWKQPKRSLMFCALTLFLGFLGCKMTGAAVLLGFWIFIFVWPFVYAKFQTKIDECFNKVMAKVQELIAKAKEAINSKVAAAKDSKKKKD